MSSLNTLYIKKETIETMLNVINKTERKGVEITIGLNDEVNQWDQNVSAWVSQTKEQRDEKKPKFYVGNGATVWTDGKITVFKKTEKQKASSTESDNDDDDLPF